MSPIYLAPNRMKDINEGDTVTVKGIFSRGLDEIAADKVEKSLGEDFVIMLMIVGILVILGVVILYFVRKR